MSKDYEEIFIEANRALEILKIIREKIFDAKKTNSSDVLEFLEGKTDDTITNLCQISITSFKEI